MTVTAHPLRQKYTRSHIKRTTTCPGCGIGTVSQAILRAIDELQLDIDDFIDSVDKYLYEAKQSGRNCICHIDYADLRAVTEVGADERAMLFTND